MSIIQHAINASEAWNALGAHEREELRRYFHLRPTKSGVTIVSTLPYAPMRGITGLKSASAVSEKLKKISLNYKKVTQDDEGAAKEFLKEGLGFNLRVEGKAHDSLEEKYQAMMINAMEQSNLAAAMGLGGGRFEFVASELIFERGKNRVDVVGVLGRNLYFFELKRDRTTKVDQVRKYVDYYGRDDKLKILKPLLENYPIRPVKEFDKIHGVMVMRYAESSVSRGMWKELAEEHRVGILFFKDSLQFSGFVSG